MVSSSVRQFILADLLEASAPCWIGCFIPVEIWLSINLGEEQELASAITVLATQEQATLLAELEQTGSIHVALVFRGDSTTAQKFLDEQNKVLEELLAKEAAETEQEAGAEEEIVNDDSGEM